MSYYGQNTINDLSTTCPRCGKELKITTGGRVCHWCQYIKTVSYMATSDKNKVKEINKEGKDD